VASGSRSARSWSPATAVSLPSRPVSARVSVRRLGERLFRKRDLDALVAEFGEIFARIYLANVTTSLTLIAFIHGVTSLHAIGNILPHGAVIADAVQDDEEDAERLIDQAVMNGDEHAIKFTEACRGLTSIACLPRWVRRYATHSERSGGADGARFCAAARCSRAEGISKKSGPRDRDSGVSCQRVNEWERQGSARLRVLATSVASP
jgi:hypothetical protein